jgi:hypothetical protein
MEASPDGYPPYAFVPGGPFPHPTGSPEGHSAGPHRAAEAIPGEDWRASTEYTRGFALFHEGYYWEAHEAWEGLWHAHGRRGPIADLLKGLIKLAAAGVKVRQGQKHGIVTHATRAAVAFEAVRSAAGDRLLGLDMNELIRIAKGIAADPPETAAAVDERVVRVFDFDLEPS